VVQFPGSNCEYETARALQPLGFDVGIVRWNRPGELRDSRAIVLPGGFSFEDRVRAGAVAAKEKIMDAVVRRAADGAFVLGICNGAQILVESGLIPGWDPQRLDAALGANMVEGRAGYLSRWVFVTASRGARKRCPWLGRIGELPVALPIAHAEGRFVFRSDDLERVHEDDKLLYCKPDGSEADGYPLNPNGSNLDLAGLVNPEGNILAMMPHPERARWMWQVPPALSGPWGDRRRAAGHDSSLLEGPGPGSLFFEGLAVSLGMEAGHE
jgi:phosphoribosylformylglycinamidine synthase